jgi:anti-anti-sigma regulatory factor
VRPTVVIFVQPPRTAIVVVDVSALTEPDAVILDALVRLQLAAQRLGTSIRLQNPCPELVDLLALVGLSDVLLVDCDGSGVEVDRQVEHREEVLVDKEVDTRDATA